MCHLIDELIGVPMNKENDASDWYINFEDEIINGAALSHAGAKHDPALANGANGGAK